MIIYEHMVGQNPIYLIMKIATWGDTTFSDKPKSLHCWLYHHNIPIQYYHKMDCFLAIVPSFLAISGTEIKRNRYIYLPYIRQAIRDRDVNSGFAHQLSQQLNHKPLLFTHGSEKRRNHGLFMGFHGR